MREQTVTFFGHRDTPKEIEPTLRSALIDLIENKNATVFYVGNHGNFDAMVHCQLEDLSKTYPIKYYIVLAYMPGKNDEPDEHSILPEGIETVPRRFAINYRNKWMLNKSDIIQNKYGFEVSLLDTHSVIWQLEEADRYVSMIEERQADAALLHEVNQNTFSEKENITEYIIQPKEKSEAIVSNGQRIYPRNRQIALNAIRHAGYCCEIDSKHESFIRRNSEYKYMEPHHLIPMSFSDRFENSLDNEANIVSLCSNCHNEIHYGKDAYKLIEKLYNQRKNVLSQAGIEITLEELIKAYK